MNYAFVGTPDFSARVLVNLVEAGRRPALVVSQPDRPRGRGRSVQKPPVVQQAECLGLPCAQSEDLSGPAGLALLRDAKVSVVVVASFGQILRQPLLDSWMCLNIHASLLPKYRGAAPIERALAAGEATTGVTIMRVTEPLDQGPWALQRSISLSLRDDAGSVARELAVLGATGIVQVLDALEDGTVRWREQEGESSYAQKLGPEDCALVTVAGAKEVHDRVRSLSPLVGVRARTGSVDFKILRTWPYGQPGLDAVPTPAGSAAGKPGTLLAAGGRLFVGCAEGVVEILRVRPVGKSSMAVSAFLRGYGARLGGLVEAAVSVANECDSVGEV